MSRVLIVDDEPAICWSFREALTDEGHAVTLASSAEQALRLTEGGCRPDVVVLDVRLPGIDGLSAMRQLRQHIGDKPVVIMTAFGSLDTAVRAVEEGAFDYLVKPFDLDQATEVLRRALEPPRREIRRKLDEIEEHAAGTIVGSSAAMQQVYRQIALVAAVDVSVLITGESGTGKELVARAIHHHSARKHGRFVPICLPALNPGLIETELFGHVRGAFTGAAEDRTGLLELAAGGTVLLDEIADIPLGLQVKLLRAIEQKEIFAVGDAASRAVDLRVLAATNQPLPELIAGGKFREDLYFRLGVFQIHLPPLRDRPDDIPPLAEHFLQQCRRANGLSNLRFSAEAVTELRSRAWPGNVRELRNAVERSAILAQNGEIRREHVLTTPLTSRTASSVVDQVRGSVAEWAATAMQNCESPDDPQLYERFLQLVEPPLLETVLRRCGQNRAAAAQLLCLHRATLRQKLRRHGIT